MCGSKSQSSGLSCAGCRQLRRSLPQGQATGRGRIDPGAEGKGALAAMYVQVPVVGTGGYTQYRLGAKFNTEVLEWHLVSLMWASLIE